MFYGFEFSPAEREKIAEAIASINEYACTN